MEALAAAAARALPAARAHKGGKGGKAAPAPAADVEGTMAQLAKMSVSELTLDEKYELARSVGEECIAESELRNLLDKKPNPVCYDGFEPSGRMHIAQGVMKALNVNKLTKSGCIFKFWVADWFALLNNKMGGDLKKIRVGAGALAACFPHRLAGADALTRWRAASRDRHPRPLAARSVSGRVHDRGVEGCGHGHVARAVLVVVGRDQRPCR